MGLYPRRLRTHGDDAYQPAARQARNRSDAPAADPDRARGRLQDARGARVSAQRELGVCQRPCPHRADDLHHRRADGSRRDGHGAVCLPALRARNDLSARRCLPWSCRRDVRQHLRDAPAPAAGVQPVSAQPGAVRARYPSSTLLHATGTVVLSTGAPSCRPASRCVWGRCCRRWSIRTCRM